MNAGFIPALGTPLDDHGYVVASGMQAQVERMISANCCVVLCMGSMGQQAFIRSRETPKIAKLTIYQVTCRVPVYVGAMDFSIHCAKYSMAAM